MADAAAAKLVGTTIAGKYRVVQLLRSGSVASVYLAEMLTLRPAPAAGPITPRVGRAARLVLKVLREQLAADRAIVKQFERGALAASHIVHPNVVRTQPPERMPSGLPFCAMELLIGLDLADALAGAGRVDLPRALRIVAAAAAGLGAVHAAGLVHLDVKPENVFLVHEPDGSEAVKILDFGHAAPIGHDASPQGAAQACGTPEYMAPELSTGALPSPATDVYALGVMLCEMVTGRPPGPALLDASWPLPPSVAPIVARATAPDPAERFATMDALRAALLAVAQADPPRRGQI